MRNKKFLSDSLWSFLSSLFSASTTLFLSIFFANRLGVNDFGIFGFAHTTIVLLSVLGTFGLNITILRYVAGNNLKKHDVSNYFFLGYISSIIVILGFIFIYFFDLFPLINENKSLVYIAIFIPFLIFSSIFEGILSGLKYFNILAKVNLIANFFYILCSLYFVGKWGVIGAVYSFCFFYTFKFLLLNLFLKKNSIIFNKINFYNLKELYKETFPIALQEVMQNTSSWIIGLLIISYASYKEVGLFNVILQIMMIMLFIPGVMKNVVLSYLSSGLESMKLSLLINISSVSIVGLSLVFFSDYFFNLYGFEFKSLSENIPIVVLICLIISISNIYVQKLISLKKNWNIFYSRLIRDLFIYSLFIIFVKFSSIIILDSILYAYFIANFLYFIFINYQVKRL